MPQTPTVSETRKICQTTNVNGSRTLADGTASGARVFKTNQNVLLVGTFGSASVQVKFRESHSIPWRNVGSAQTAAGRVALSNTGPGFVDVDITAGGTFDITAMTIP